MTDASKMTRSNMARNALKTRVVSVAISCGGGGVIAKAR